MLAIYADPERLLADLGLAREDSQEASIDLVRGLLRAFSERDFDRGLRDVDSDVVGRYEDPFAGPVTFRGRDEVRGWWERIHHGWDQLESQIEEVIEERADLLVLAVRFKARGKQSGLEVEGEDQFQVWRLRDGKITSFEFFADRAKALEAARSPADLGLPTEAESRRS
jgi:ketosteroid isomerase-like protein